MKLHFIAIGGSAMHNLAIALKDKGYQISGSDDVIYEPARSRLAKYSLLPGALGWFIDKIDDSLDAIILGMHARENNPELLKALDLGIRIYSYPEFIFEQSKDKTRVVIGGSHGKTTVTSMILHVLSYNNKEVDYMVGAQLEGFENMVRLTDDNDFILLEGDEYLSSPLDRRPKFHIYKPNIALLTGIAWDHINVFPNFENYIDQFRLFIDSIVSGGTLVYNQEDSTLVKLAEETQNQIRKHPYITPDFRIQNGITVLDTPEGEMALEIVGTHNMSNLAGAKWICQHMGVDEDDFYEAIASFKGAAKRLEKIAENGSTLVYKDFAHSPSKVVASTKAVKEQFPLRKLYACLELHTFSSLSPQFLPEYKNSLEMADQAVVFFSPEALEHKKMAILSQDDIKKAFGKENLIVITDPVDFQQYLEQLDYQNSVLLLMSSGTYGGLNYDNIKTWISS